MTDIYTKQFIAMRYWLLGRNYFLALDALEYAAKLHTGTRKDGQTQEYFHQLSIGRYVKSISTSTDNIRLSVKAEGYVAPFEIEEIKRHLEQ